MIKLENIKHIYFLGIGGIGMSAIARYFVNNNYSVAGYDKNSSDITRSLEAESCRIFYQELETVNFRNSSHLYASNT